MQSINFKTIFRSLVKSKSYTLLNLIGLASGLLVFILITLYTQHEFSYDNYHEKGDRIYRIFKEDTDNFYQGTNRYAVVPTPLAPTLKEEYPEVEDVARVNWYSNTVVKVGDETFLEPQIYAADPGIFNLFTLNVIAGNNEQILVGPKAAVISESIALKYFGKTDVIGEVIRFRDQYPFQISGVIKDMPQNSHFEMDIILNFEGLIMELDGPERMAKWSNSSYYAFALLTPQANAQALEDKLPELRTKYANDPVDEDGQESTYFLQPLNDVHFTKDVNFDLAPSADAQALYIYMGIAFMILVIACINYVNLATARAINKTKEIGVRKVIGAYKGHLILSFMVESGILVFTAIVFALGSLMLILPSFSAFIDKEIVLDFSSSQFWLLIVILGVLMTFVSGIYPSLMLARFKPIIALKGKGNTSRNNTILRNALVVFQFAISCALIFGATILTKQLNFIQTLDTGYAKDRIVVIGVRDRGVRKQLDVFKEELRQVGGVVKVSSSNSLPNNFSSNSGANWVGKREDENVVLYTNTADYDFVDLYELELVEGRNFDSNIESDEKAILLNESAVKELGWEDPIGKQMIRWWGDTGRVVGVLKDFHVHSMHLEIEPIQIFQRSGQFNVSVKIEGDNVEETIKELEAKYQEFNPVYPFDYNFFDDIFDRAYLSEIKTAELANWFTVLAIIIACLGLYGLAAHKVQHRIKEVGVRKVLGASVTRILILLSKDFGILLIIAFAIAAPLAYWVMDGWLNNFAYHTTINMLTFFFALVIMVLVAGITVSYRTYKAAVRNPVESLRDE